MHVIMYKDLQKPIRSTCQADAGRPRFVETTASARRCSLTGVIACQADAPAVLLGDACCAEDTDAKGLRHVQVSGKSLPQLRFVRKNSNNFRFRLDNIFALDNIFGRACRSSS